MKVVKSVLVASMLAAGISGFASASPAELIEIQPKDYVSTYLLDDTTRSEIRKNNLVLGFGEADYAFETPAASWWEFWVEKESAAPFDLIVDQRAIIHSSISSDVWASGGEGLKMLNLYLPAGKHRLQLRGRIHAIGKMRLKKAKDFTGMVRTELVGDCLAIRRNQGLSLKLLTGKGAEERQVKVTVTPAGSTEPVWEKEYDFPAGEGNDERLVELPSSKEGAFDVRFTDAGNRPVDRTIQYLVVDVENRPDLGREPQRELVQEIDCAKQEPDYASGATTSVGAYRESGTKGRIGFKLAADWFAYTLKLPSVQEPYLVEIEYPDDDERVALIALIDRYPNPYAPTLGYASGGVYSLSGETLREDFYFYPREKDTRLLIQNWRTGLKAAMGKVRVYRLSSPPAALDVPAAGRLFGGYQEENIRFTSYYGATPDGNGWDNYFKTACRFAMQQKFLGGNFWQQTIANYQETLWPNKTVFGYAPVEMPGMALQGPRCVKHPVPLDIVRLQLLVCEKFGMDYLGELHLSANQNSSQHLDKLFGGKGTITDNGPRKPWLAVSNTGECGNMSKAYWNPFYPGVQDWAASMVAELAARYKDSKAFKGVALRVMRGWCFPSWQTVRDLNWGYEDFTVELFEKETGTKVPVDPKAADRFTRRHEWLTKNAHDQWVAWRCAKIYAYHARLAKILTDARPDLKLYIADCADYCDAGVFAAANMKGKSWNDLTKEYGLDAALYKKNPAMALQSVVTYPSAAIPDPFRRKTPLDSADLRDVIWDARRLPAAAAQGENAIYFNADSFEGEMIDGKALGYGDYFEKTFHKPTIHGAGVVNPAGIHYLERFAESMAQGNVTLISDGSHGYDQQQPEYLRPFLREYRNLPAMGMKPVEVDADPVAVWQGVGSGKMFFYVVNRLDVPVEATLRFEGAAAPRRLSTDEELPLDGGAMKLKLAPYQLLAFEGGEDSARVVAVSASTPEPLKDELERQLAFAEGLLSGKSELTAAKQRLAEVRDAIGKGRLCSARHMLLSLDLVKAYEALHAYPPGLLHRKDGKSF